MQDTQGWIQKIVLGGAHWTWVAEDDEARRRRRWGGDVWAGSLPPPQPMGERRISSSRVWGGAPATHDFGHYTRNFVWFHACFNALWNITGKANKTDPIRSPLPIIGLEGARAPCAPRLDPPMAAQVHIYRPIVPSSYHLMTYTCQHCIHCSPKFHTKFPANYQPWYNYSASNKRHRPVRRLDWKKTTSPWSKSMHLWTAFVKYFTSKLCTQHDWD